MLERVILEKKLGDCLKETSLGNQHPAYRGKVRDVYDLKDRLLIITTDRQSAFDRNLAHIPFKGQVLNQTSQFWFEETKDIVGNHVLAYPDPNAVLTKKAKIFPIEFVMRGFLTGVTSTAVWTSYSKGEREYCGHTFPDGMVKNQAFEEPILTPTTKSDEHDEKISADEILKRNLMSEVHWQKASAIVHALFRRGQAIAKEHGLILVDTKYELGLGKDGEIILCDEIHTPDSSRYWLAETYEEKFKLGQEPDYIDKEFLRLWFKEHSDPYSNAALPEAPKDLVVELASRYIQLYEMITDKAFSPGEMPVIERLKRNLSHLF